MRCDHSIYVCNRWLYICIHTDGDYTRSENIPDYQKYNPFRWEICLSFGTGAPYTFKINNNAKWYNPVMKFYRKIKCLMGLHHIFGLSPNCVYCGKEISITDKSGRLKFHKYIDSLSKRLTYEFKEALTKEDYQDHHSFIVDDGYHDNFMLLNELPKHLQHYAFYYVTLIIIARRLANGKPWTINHCTGYKDSTTRQYYTIQSTTHRMNSSFHIWLDAHSNNNLMVIEVFDSGIPLDHLPLEPLRYFN